MKISSNFQTLGILGTLVFSLIALSACAPSPVDASSEILDLPVTENPLDEGMSALGVDIATADEDGSIAIESEKLEQALAQEADRELSQEEIDGLLFMREEEKLAHDVYIELYNIWGLPIFQNIAQSEQTHTDAVLTLINRYGLEDPASEFVGDFTNAALQDLYNMLIAQGSQSLIDALKVGITIEEIDILDLQENINNTNQADINMVYENLMKGSRNHLRSFVSTYDKQTGESYIPQYLTQDAFDEIIGSTLENGGNGNGQGRNQNNRQTKGV